MPVLILGASRGIGLELVRQCRAAGDAVVATARTPEGLAQLSALGVKPVALDVASSADCAGLARAIDGERFDQVWLVAGVYGPRSSAPETPTEAEFDAVMHTNVLAAMRLLPQVTDALAPGAKVAVISSVMASIGQRSGGNGWLYRASKAALNSVVRDMAFVLEGKASCVALHPGWVRTDMGGPQAAISVEHSATDLRQTVGRLTLADSGRFLNHDGAPLPW